MPDGVSPRAIERGLKNKKTAAVAPENTAAAMGSGALAVYATPAMVALMEATAAESVAPLLGAGRSTVGTALDIKHLSATPAGMAVWCESELTAVEGRKLTFFVRAFDGAGVIGEGTHERFIVDDERFIEKANKKKGGADDVGVSEA